MTKEEIAVKLKETESRFAVLKQQLEDAERRVTQLKEEVFRVQGEYRVYLGMKKAMESTNTPPKPKAQPKKVIPKKR